MMFQYSDLTMPPLMYDLKSHTEWYECYVTMGVCIPTAHQILNHFYCYIFSLLLELISRVYQRCLIINHTTLCWLFYYPIASVPTYNDTPYCCSRHMCCWYVNCTPLFKIIHSKFVYCRNRTSYARFKLELPMCAQNMALGTPRRYFQLQILT